MCEYIFINTGSADKNKTKISVNEPGFLYGDGLFETMRSYKGFLYKLDEHMNRLISSAKILRHTLYFDKSYITRSLDKLLKKNMLKNSDAYIKIMITRGGYKERLKFDFSLKSNLIIIASKFIPYSEEFYNNGVRLISSGIKRNAFGNDLYRHKLTSYFENIFAKNEAYLQGAQESIFLTKNRIVLEGSVSNIFSVKDNVVFTPSLAQNIIPGIARDAVIEICHKNKIKVSERKVYYGDLIKADEIFITNSLMEVMPVKEIDRYKIGDGAPGKVSSNIMSLYKQECTSHQ
ncbi:MAG: aminotransferase class IV [Actinobacteria bacterium]|nr:aminotransferase class IV [Actinomycetota bacterium]